MESNMKAFVENVEIEHNNLLHELIAELKTENQNLHEEKILLEKAIEKQKKFHRK